MKKLLSFALTLWSLVSLAQTTTKIAELNPAPGKYGSKYYVYYERDWTKYPGTLTGLTSLTNAIASGQLQLRVTTTGCIIPAGTKPPANPPTCTNPSGLPILASNSGLLSRYTYSSGNGGTLQVRASGASSAQLKIETQGGQTLTLSNSQNPTIPYNTFVGYGPSGDSSYPYDWTFYGVPAVPIRVSMKTSGNADVAAFTPAVGTNVPLSGSTGTVNPPTGGSTITYRPISKVLIEGNSIAYYPTNAGFGWLGNWGAWASAANKDFVHILTDSIHTIYPQADVRIWGQNNEAGISIAEGGYFEQSYDNLDGGLSRYDALAQYAPDYLIVRLGENVTDVRSTFQQSWINQINKVTSLSTNPQKLITTSVWGNSTVDNALISLASAIGSPLVDLRNIPNSRSGTGTLGHPLDDAHLVYAKRIWASMKASLATTTSTTTSPGSGTGVSDGDFVAGAFDFADLPQVNVPSDYRASLETDKIRVTLDLKEGHEPDKGLAGGIRFFIDKATGYNTLNVPVFQKGSGDDYGHPLGTVNDGRSINECLYRNPSPWSLNGVALGIGDNVNETGDGAETPSRLISFHRDANTLQTKIEPNQWDGNGLRTGEEFKKWIRVNGNEMRVWYESKFNRTSATGANERQESKVQEAPCNYLNGNHSTIYFYDGDTPYQNASPRSFRLEDNSGMTPGATFLTENWVAGCDPSTGRCQGMILETPATQIGQFQSKGTFNADGSLLSSTYIAYYPFQMLDYNIRWRHSTIFVVGTLAEIRAKAYQYTSWKRTLEVRFNKSGRQNWGGRWYNDGGYKESRSSWGPITWTSNEGEIVTPAVALDGNIKKMYMRYKYTSTTRQNVNMVARWLRARQAGGYSNGTALWNERFPEGAAVGDDYAKTFSLIADGQWHVKEIDFSDKAQWRQIITQVRFTNDGASAIGESLEVEWFSGSANGPTN